jgi:hypothetical protein
MDSVALSLTDQIEIVGDNISVQVDRTDLALDMDIEGELKRYREDAKDTSKAE